MSLSKELTSDTFFNGAISVKQPLHGYRFSIDAVILGNLAPAEPGDRVADFGCGCGVIPLIICYRNPGIKKIFGVELQDELSGFARLNARVNNMDERICILHKDIKNIVPEDTRGRVDLIVCNPPHFPANSGRINPNSQRAIARHEITITLDDITAAASRMLKPAGRLTVIFPSERLTDLLVAMRNADIEPKHLRLIHPRPKTEAKRVILTAIKGKSSNLRVAPPLFIRTSPDKYSDELNTMFSP
jgi:tRNA1Val (adenine37-N6)-methyltransferase